MGRTLETAAVDTKSSLPLLTRYRPLRFTSPVQPDVWTVPAVARGTKKIGFPSLVTGRGRPAPSLRPTGLTEAISILRRSVALVGAVGRVVSGFTRSLTPESGDH